MGSKAATARSRDIGTGPGVDPQKLAVLVSTNISGLRTPGPATDGTSASELRGDETILQGPGKYGALTIITQHARPGMSQPREDPVCVQLCAEKVVRPRGSPHTCVRPVTGVQMFSVELMTRGTGGLMPLVSYMSVRAERCSSFPVNFCPIYCFPVLFYPIL